MKKLITLSLLATITATTAIAQKDNSGYPITQVPFTSVKVQPETFWGQRLKASREVTIPLAFSKCEETGRYTNFSNAAAHMKDPSKVFKVNGVGYSFDDTDPYKTIEGASYLLQTYPDKKLEAYVDSVIAVIKSGQEPDGYLYTARTQNPDDPHHWAGPTRWSKVEDLSHEFYNLGHLCEAAVAHYQATGKTSLLNIAKAYADCVCREVGEKPGQACVVPGHQIAEMGLAKLYLATGDKKYLDQAKFFLDKRGYTTIKTEYSQSHQPVLQQKEAVGHAVRAGYMYAGMADVAALTGDKGYIDAIDNIWDNIITKKYYITGGVGATASGEAFGANYELPNMSAYCETCAAIAQVYLNYRLFLLHGESKYYDALERTLYNGVISGISIDGGKFFYPNPLQSMGQHQRQPWFGCACCPSNAARFIPSVPQYVYAVKDNNLYVNLFMGNTAKVSVGGKSVEIQQTTNYPWDGDITMTMQKASGKFALNIRIPGWVRGEVVPSDLYTYTDGKRLGYTVMINNQSVTSELKDGYFVIDRKWKKGDKISVHFDMEPRTVKANGKVAADKGRVAIERGPLVYCAEWPDNTCDVLNVLLNQEPKFVAGDKTIEGTNVMTLTTDAQTLNFSTDGRLQTKDERLVLIPYYAWAHRGNGNMAVWLPIDLNATNPALPPSIASESKVTCSKKHAPALSAVNDRLIPADKNDRSVPYTHWWPEKNTTEWLVYTFKEATTVQSSTVYWFDDSPWGGCRVPASWKLYYKNDKGEWEEVKNPSRYPCEKGVACTVDFDPVKTTKMKLEIVQPEEHSCGVFEWSLK
ncbi:MAG: glycoside hydrolase family 127 protein [Bacteroides sp.]|nr:glycoside hydrolase family 127 protein [Roseburia sp.]MCM1347749.1 glycoside hydrolase family 127 protein [Bacteroides sp.]MCM1422144.1 glycoside hydrolase family 127 protein [Bacteroides sp.]